MSEQPGSPKKRDTKRASKRNSSSQRARKTTKVSLNGRIGVALIGSSLIVCVLALVALLPLRRGFLAGNSGGTDDETPALIAAPLVQAEVTVPPTAPPTPDEGQEPSEDEPEAAVASLPLQPDIQPTPDGTFREGRVPILMYHYVSTPPEDAERIRIYVPAPVTNIGTDQEDKS